MGKVIGPGSLNIDLTGYAPHLPVDGETTAGHLFQTAPGGKGGNQMTAAFRAGAETVLIGCIGNESLSAVLLDHYQKEGMRMDHIRLSDTASTGVALIEVNEITGQNRIMVIAGANQEVNADAVENAREEFATAQVVMTQLETPLDSLLAAKAMAKEYHLPFILNPAPYQSLDASVFSGIDYVTPNETEAASYTGIQVESVEDARRSAAVFLEMGVKKVIITLGSQGSYFSDGSIEYLIPALKVQAIDTTGAGDAFNGAFAAALSDGMDDLRSLHFATCTSAISVTRKGAAPSMPQKEEILELMRREFPEDF